MTTANRAATVDTKTTPGSVVVRYSTAPVPKAMLKEYKRIEDTTAKLKDVLKRRREELSLSQTDMAKALGIASSEFISMVESGRRRFAMNNVPAVADVLRLNREDLCRLALFEEAPQMAMALYGTNPDTYHEIRQGQRPETGAQYEERQIAYHSKLWNLPNPFRITILNSIDQYTELINAKTPLPRIAE